jgi:tRNA(adenine34) deaminase
MTSDERFMRAALEEAQLAMDGGDVPVGAVLVMDGEIVGRGRNRRVAENDPLAHAEVDALRRAAASLGAWRFDGASLYVTLEPCPMCAGSLIQARVSRVVFGAYDIRGGGVRSLFQICEDKRLAHRLQVQPAVLEQECADLLQSFFRRTRQRKNR